MILHTYQYVTSIRLDRFLKQLYPNITQGVIQNALRKNLIKVNNIKAKEASLRIIKADGVEVPQHFEQYLQEKHYSFSPSVISLGKKILDKYIIFDNDDFIAINKPAKIAVQGGSGINISIDDALKYFNSKGGDFKLVHRLDKETSGLMLIAKHYDAAVKLTGAFRDKKISKTYLAITNGIPESKKGIIEIGNEITQYNVLKSFAENAYIEFRPITGKEHQIRRHALELGVSIIGDRKYGNNEANKSSSYMLLHSYKALIHPDIWGHPFELVAPLPEYFKRILESL